MKYYKQNKTGDVYAYEQSDIDTVDSIDALENELSRAQKKLANTPNPPEFVPEYDENGKQTNSDANAAEREEYQAAQTEVSAAQASLDEVLPVFFDIREKLKDMREMTPEEVEAHINPVPTTEQLAEQARAERDAKIEAVRWRIERAKDEAALGIPLTEPLEPLLQYVQALRDVPAQTGFPEIIEWPVEP